MKNQILYFLVFSIFFSVSSAYGQDYTFKVLANKGANQVKKAGAADAVPLKTGSTLQETDQLIVVEGSYIGLMHKSGKTIEVRDAGTSKVADLEKKVAVKSESVSSKYAQFIASKMADDGTVTLAQRMNATGAVSRAAGGTAIDVILPQSNSIDVLGSTAVINWLAPPAAGQGAIYEVKIMDIFDEVIFTDETAKTQITLDFEDESMANESGLYIFSVKLKDNNEVVSGKFGIKRVADGEMTEVVKNYEGLQSEINESESPLNKLIYASFFEENGLILDALTKYEEAIKLSPDVADFQELYEAFKFNNGLKFN